MPQLDLGGMNNVELLKRMMKAINSRHRKGIPDFSPSLLNSSSAHNNFSGQHLCHNPHQTTAYLEATSDNCLFRSHNPTKRP
jgi:hypothetical protein